MSKKGAGAGREVRLQKRMAQLGVASRRESERLIDAGRVAVNGVVVTEQGTKVTPEDVIVIDGQVVDLPDEPAAWVLHKPVGVVCTARDPEGRETIYDLLRPFVKRHLAYVGRLDVMTEGVLLLMADGDLAQRLTRPDSAVPRVYEAKIRGRLSQADRLKLEEGIPMDGRPTRPAVIERIPSDSKHDWLRITLFEGRNRHVHRLMEAVGHSVTRLRRVSFGGITVDGLRSGHARPMELGEVERLRSLSR